MTRRRARHRSRAEQMSLVKGRDTAPEMRVRRALWAAGLRYRLHSASLPGKPDLVMHGRRACVFVHGCFWHRHDCASGRREPKSNREFWLAKFDANLRRDQIVQEQLRALGWDVNVIWECETRSREKIGALVDRLTKLPHARF